MHPLAGNLSAWPRSVPAAAGQLHAFKWNVADQGMQPALVHVAMLGDYNLLVGRDNALFAPLQTRFWYGLAAAIAVLSIAGLLVGLITRRALMSRVHSIRQTVSAIMHGDLKHRLPTHLNDDELNTLSRTINGMLEQIELLVHGVRNVSNSIAHDLRTPLAELRSRLEELALIRPPPAEDLRRNRRRGRGRRPGDPHIRRAAAPRGNRRRHAPLRFRASRRGRPGVRMRWNSTRRLPS